jgi:EF-P lysine aminoacylase GenX
MADWKQLKNNPSLINYFKKRASLIQKTRNFFTKEGFLEVQTPILAPRLIPESYLEVFETEIKNKNNKKQRAFLTTSPEMWLKKLLVAGVGNCFEITKSFRNTDLSEKLHSPEFTILEWYRISKGIKETMADCENLIRFLNNNKSTISYQGKILNIKKPFIRLSIVEAFEKWIGIDKKDFFNKSSLLRVAQEKGYQGNEKDSWDEIYNWLYVSEIEPRLGLEAPTFIYDFPSQFAPLAKTKKSDKRFKERFELYLFGIELADAYYELNDWQEQKKQFEKEKLLRKRMGAIEYPSDEDFIQALKRGLPDCSGVALGIDRLMMILLNAESIHQVILFSGKDLWKI